MAKIEPKATLTFTCNLTLSESETRALDAMVGYGFDAFTKVFYEHLGKAYLKEHESGLKSLFETIQENIPIQLSQIDKARQLLIPTQNIASDIICKNCGRPHTGEKWEDGRGNGK